MSLFTGREHSIFCCSTFLIFHFEGFMMLLTWTREHTPLQNKILYNIYFPLVISLCTYVAQWLSLSISRCKMCSPFPFSQATCERLWTQFPWENQDPWNKCKQQVSASLLTPNTNGLFSTCFLVLLCFSETKLGPKSPGYVSPLSNSHKIHLPRGDSTSNIPSSNSKGSSESWTWASHFIQE